MPEIPKASGRGGRCGPSEPILHVDLDAFYASVEVLKDPSLQGKPVVVGSAASRGVVMSASYEARARGLRSAMPSVRARRLCPEVVFVPPDFPSYVAYSNRFREVLLAHSPAVEPIALDEAFVDVRGAMMLFGTPPQVAARIRAAVREELALTASVGVGPNKFVAKLASTRAKPDGLLVVPSDEVLSFLHPLPVDALGPLLDVPDLIDVWRRLGLRTLGHLAALDRADLLARFGQDGVAAHRLASGPDLRPLDAHDLLELAHGRDGRQVVPFEAPKSVSHEETYPRDLDGDEEVLREILSLSHRVAARLRAEGYRARTVTLKLRLPSFSTLTRSRTLPEATDTAADVYHVARQLLLRLPPGRRRFRLIGVAGSGLEPAGAEQVSLVREGRWRDAERALDRVTGRFGRGTALPAALLDRSVGRGSGGDRGVTKPFL